MRRDRRDPLPTRLRDAILSLQPTAYWPLDDSGGPLRDIAGGRWDATVTGSPTFRVAAPEPIGRGVTWSGTGQYATTSGSVPTPAASLSVVALFQTTNATASVRHIASRFATDQASWRLNLAATHQVQFTAFQSTGTAHCTATSTGTQNDGAWRLVTAWFDGTTCSVRVNTAAANTSASLTGSWHRASTAGVGIAHRGDTFLLFPGTVAHVAVFRDRIVNDAAHLWLHSIVAGG